MKHLIDYERRRWLDDLTQIIVFIVVIVVIVVQDTRILIFHGKNIFMRVLYVNFFNLIKVWRSVYASLNLVIIG